MAEVVIAGASFAGLAVARALKGKDVLLLEPHPVGANPKSACAMPLDVIEALGADDAVLETHSELIFHLAGKTVRLPSKPPFATIDYGRFCQLLLADTDAQLVTARALGYQAGKVMSSSGEIDCRFAVDATGPAAVLASALKPDYARKANNGAGLEVAVPRPKDFPGGLHFYLGGGLPPGYGWAFGSKQVVRFGIGVFDAKNHAKALKPALTQLLAQHGLEANGDHGGLVPLWPREPVLNGLFVVGDAAGQVLPTSAEGIRPALFFGQLLGKLLKQVLAGDLEASKAQAIYRQAVRRRLWAYRSLRAVQGLLASTPSNLSGGFLQFGTRLGLAQPMYRRYLAAFRDVR